ncbi:MAG: glycosyltransferase [Bacteroides sp.]|nr:glycosyltransferase [Bacteroides sp.]
MKISIITATYNSGATLRDTLESILNQSYPDYEVLIIDGGSKDSTKQIVDEYIPKFNGKLKWHTGKDKGLYDAMNKGISRAAGDIIGILNSDDFYATPDVLETIAKTCERVEAVYGDLDFVDEENTDKVVRQWRGSQHEPGAFLKGWHPAHPTFYARRECYERLGGFDISFDVSADFELMLRFIEKGRLSNRYIPKTFVKMRMGGESTGSISKIIQGNKNVLRAFRKNGFKVPKFYLVRRLTPKALNIIKNKLHI